jgi:transcriptional regulator with XRE-family HTH domain
MRRGSKPQPVPLDSANRAMGEAFRLARKRAGFGLREASEQLGVSINTIRWHEAGSHMMRADTVRKAAMLFDCSADALMAMEP